MRIKLFNVVYFRAAAEDKSETRDATRRQNFNFQQSKKLTKRHKAYKKTHKLFKAQNNGHSITELNLKVGVAERTVQISALNKPARPPIREIIYGRFISRF